MEYLELGERMRRGGKARGLSVLTTLVVAILLASAPALGDTFTVTNTNDSGRGSLRTAIAEANEDPGKDIITFAPGVSGEIRLRSALPTLTGELEVRGPGANRLTVRRAADRAFRVFTVARNSTVRISNLKVTNGQSPSGSCNLGCDEDDYGGGMFNEGNLTLRGVTVSANTAGGGGGGGIYNADGATLTVEDGTFSANRTAFSFGGGIWNDGTLTVSGTVISSHAASGLYNSGDATIMGSTLSDNLVGIENSGLINDSEDALLTLRDTTISRNRSGGIYDYGGEVTVEGSTFSGNTDRSSSGGAITAYHDTVRVTDSTFTDNRARVSGGAIYQTRDGILTVEGSTFSGNRARENNGGAIRSSRGSSATITQSTFSGNTAWEDGGAINASDGTLQVEGSTFLANSALQEGGGVFALRGGVTLLNSTFARNEAAHGGGLYYYGVLSSGLNLRAATFANNHATDAGGGIYSDSAREDIVTIYPRTTIVANNDAPEGPDVFGPFESRGYNLIGDPSGSSGFGGTDLTNTAAGLDPDGLQDNGGPTKTFALTQSSPALDAVEEGCPPPATDQRGVSRPQNGDGEGGALCDIGAYERRAPSQ